MPTYIHWLKPLYLIRLSSPCATRRPRKKKKQLSKEKTMLALVGCLVRTHLFLLGFGFYVVRLFTPQQKQ